MGLVSRSSDGGRGHHDDFMACHFETVTPFAGFGALLSSYRISATKTVVLSQAFTKLQQKIYAADINQALEMGDTFHRINLGGKLKTLYPLVPTA